jgi:glycosyltransferase involved in cell wall biosynthesis
MNGETILCIAPRNWRSLWRESQQIMSRMARQNRVLYFEPGRDGNEPLLAEMSRNWSNFFSVHGQTLHENLAVIPSPARLPIGRRHLPRHLLEVTTPWVAKTNNAILVRHVRRAMKVHDVKDPILWLYSPYNADLVGKFGEKLTCYHNYDEFPDMVHNARIKRMLRQFDNRLSSRVDVVFATSRAQWQRRQAMNPDSYFVPNGVNFDLFNRALSANLPLPADLADIPRPIIGFAGWMGYQVDVELLYRVAETYADCSLVLVGPDQLPNTATRQRLRNRPNVFFLGQKEPDQLPNYLQVFDVALMPYLLNEGHVRSAYPLKLHEYLAAGRSIVTVALPEVRPFSGVVRMAETHDEFIRDIGQALGDHASEAIQARVAVAQENTWDHRVAEMYRVLEQHLSATATRSRSAKGSPVDRDMIRPHSQPDTLSGALDHP